MTGKSVFKLAWRKEGDRYEIDKVLRRKRFHLSWPGKRPLIDDLCAMLELKELGVDLQALLRHFGEGKTPKLLENLGPKGAIDWKTFLEGAYTDFRKARVRVFEQERGRIGQLVEEPAFAGKELHRIDTAMIQCWFNEYSARPGIKSNNTRALMLFVVRGAFKHATNLQYLRQDPSLPVKPPRLPKTSRKAISYEAARRLSLASPVHVREWLAMALYTGLRPHELAKLRVIDVDLEERFIQIKGDTEKNRDRNIYIHDEILSVVKAKVSAVANVPFFRDDKGGPAAFPRRAFETARAKVGFEKVSLYSLRHTFRTWLSKAGVQWDVAEYLMGHKLTDVGFTYIHHDPEQSRGAIQRLPKLELGWDGDPKSHQKSHQRQPRSEETERGASGSACDA